MVGLPLEFDFGLLGVQGFQVPALVAGRFFWSELGLGKMDCRASLATTGSVSRNDGVIVTEFTMLVRHPIFNS
jgi:hypothetical protein